MAKREKLVAARLRKHWSQEKAAEEIGINAATLSRWENGISSPHPYNIDQLANAYGLTAFQLGLEAENRSLLLPFAPGRESLAFLNGDLTTRLLGLAFLPHDVRRIQQQFLETLEVFDAMSQDKIQRRDALRRISAMTLLAAPTPTAPWAIEATLKQCASSLAASWQLSKSSDSTDLALASDSAAACQLLLDAAMKDSSKHRSDAATLAGQAALLQGILGWHRESLEKALAYLKQASIYGQEAGDLPLQIAVLTQRAWIYYYNNRFQSATEAISAAASLLKQIAAPTPISLASSVYSTRAVILAYTGSGQQAITSIRLAHEHFFAGPPSDTAALYVDYSLPSLILEGGMAHTNLGLYDDAGKSFDQMINADFSSKIAAPERVHIEGLNSQALASLKNPVKDMERTIQLWRAGIEGAKSLKSEQRFKEALSLYNIMECVWPAEPRVRELRALAQHW